MVQTQLDSTTSAELAGRWRWPRSVPVLFALSFLLVIYMVAADVIFGVNMLAVAQWNPMTADLQHTLSVCAWFLSVPLAAMLAGVGAAIATGMPSRRLWLMIGILVLAIGAPLGGGIIATVFPAGWAARFPPLVFGSGGVLIIASVLLTCWFWGQARPKSQVEPRRGSDLRLIAYVLFGLAAWWTCGLAAQTVAFGSRAADLVALIYCTMTDLVLGWALLLPARFWPAVPRGAVRRSTPSDATAWRRAWHQHPLSCSVSSASEHGGLRSSCLAALLRCKEEMMALQTQPEPALLTGSAGTAAPAPAGSTPSDIHL